MKKKNRNKSLNKNSVALDSEDVEDILSMNHEDREDAREELQKDAEHSQAEGFAKRLAKLSEAERAETLRRLRREDILLFETVEYLLRRILARKD